MFQSGTLLLKLRLLNEFIFLSAQLRASEFLMAGDGLLSKVVQQFDSVKSVVGFRFLDWHGAVSMCFYKIVSFSFVDS